MRDLNEIDKLYACLFRPDLQAEHNVADAAELKMYADGLRTPQMESHETEKELQLRFELPGVTKEHIQLSSQENELELSTAMPENDSGKNRPSNFFTRVKLQEPLDPAKADAEYENGILDVRIPKEKTNVQIK